MKFPLVCLICAKKSRTLIFKIPPPPIVLKIFYPPKYSQNLETPPPLPLKRRTTNFVTNICILFQYILNVVGPKIPKKRYQLQKSNIPFQTTCLAIHYLAYGNSQHDLSFTYCIGRSTVSVIIRETCEAIWDSLSE